MPLAPSDQKKMGGGSNAIAAAVTVRPGHKNGGEAAGGSKPGVLKRQAPPETERRSEPRDPGKNKKRKQRQSKAGHRNGKADSGSEPAKDLSERISGAGAKGLPKKPSFVAVKTPAKRPPPAPIAEPAQTPASDATLSPAAHHGEGITYHEAPVFEHILQVGEGTYGKVYKARNTDTGKILALKRLRLDSEREGMPITAIREIKLLQSLRHTNVVSLLEMVVSGKHIYMAFEYLEHDLAGLLLNPGLTLSPAHIKSLFLQLTRALAYLHHKHILHRDIKGSNVLVSRSGQVKLADFGLARPMNTLSPHAHYTNRVITLWYRPPELLLGATNYGPAVDVWGVGCLLPELFLKSALFQGTTEVSQLDEVLNVMGGLDAAAWPGVTELPWYYLLQDGHDRMRPCIFDQVFTDVTPACFDLASRMLALNPADRLSARAALEHEYFKEDPAPADLHLESAAEWHDFEAKRRRKRNGK